MGWKIMKKIILLFTILLTLASLVSANGVLVNRADIIPNDGGFSANIAVENTYDYEVGRTKFSMLMYDYDVYASRYADSLDENDPVSKTLVSPYSMTIEDGCYMVRVVVSNDNFRRVKNIETCYYNGVQY